jgi:hypothetical protein
MRRSLSALISSFIVLSFAALGARAQAPTPIPITGNIGYITGGGTPYASLNIELVNCPPPVSITGYAIIAPMQYQLQADGTGLINSTIWPVDKITCNGTTGASEYSVTYIVNGTPSADPSCYQPTSTAGIWNLLTLQPITCSQSPPNPQDAQYQNLVVLGNAAFSHPPPPSLKGTVLYASSSCAVNSSITSGGGTDDSACLQTLLTRLGTAGGGKLVMDGVSLISGANVTPTGQTTALQIGSNTEIECAVNGGFYLNNNSNVTMLGNAISGTGYNQTNIRVTNCAFNENGANQSKSELGNTNNFWVLGMWFGGIDGLTIKGNTMLNARTFSYTFSLAQNVVFDDNSTIQTAGEGSGGNNHDGIHFLGPVTNFYAKNYRDVFGDDDAIAFNTDEGVYDYQQMVARGGMQPARFPSSGGALQDITIDTVYVDNGNDALRWIGYGVGTPTVANITLRNIFGNPNNFGSACCGTGVTATGGITVDGWWLGSSTFSEDNLTLPPGAAPLNLKNIAPWVPVTIPSVGSTSIEMAPTAITVNSGAFSALNTAWRSTALSTIALDNTGNLFFGFDQPMTIFRAGSINAAFLSNATGSGYTNKWQFPTTTWLQALGIVTTTGATLDDGSGNTVLQSLKVGTGPVISNSNILPQVGTPTVNQAACIKAAGPPVVIGYCSTVVSAGGACTCN